MEMKQFDLQEYLKKPQRKIVTKGGERARIICTDRNPYYPIVALVGETTEVCCYTKKGQYFGSDGPSLKDLCFEPRKREGWLNIYHYDTAGNANTSRRIYDTKEEAVACENKGRIDTIKIEWEE